MLMVCSFMCRYDQLLCRPLSGCIYSLLLHIFMYMYIYSICVHTHICVYYTYVYIVDDSDNERQEFVHPKIRQAELKDKVKAAEAKGWFVFFVMHVRAHIYHVCMHRQGYSIYACVVLIDSQRACVKQCI